MRNKLNTLYAATAIFTAVSLPAFAATPTLKVTTIETPPAAYKNPETKQVEGIAVDKVRELAKRCDVNVEVTIQSAWTRAYDDVVSGEMDGLIPTTFTEERLALFDFAQPALVDFNISLIVPLKSPYTEFTGYNMLDGKVIGIRTGAEMGDSVKEYLATDKAEVVGRVNSTGLSKILFSKQVDFLIDSPWSFADHLGENRSKRAMRVIEPHLETSPQYLALSKKRAAPFAAGTPISECLLGNATSSR